MASSPVPASDPPTAHAAAFEQLLVGIVGGTFPPRSRLPPERELARLCGASRPTLREALRRLAEWRMVAARRGSGVEVLERSEWSIEALPSYLFRSNATPAAQVELVRDLLALRAALVEQMVRLVGHRVDPVRLAPARTAFERAWEQRGNPTEFVQADLAAMRAVVEAANFLPGVWLLNRLASVYLDIASNLSGALGPPSIYPRAHRRFLEELSARDIDSAVAVLADYLAHHDRRLLAGLDANR